MQYFRRIALRYFKEPTSARPQYFTAALLFGDDKRLPDAPHKMTLESMEPQYDESIHFYVLEFQQNGSASTLRVWPETVDFKPNEQQLPKLLSTEDGMLKIKGLLILDKDALSKVLPSGAFVLTKNRLFSVEPGRIDASLALEVARSAEQLVPTALEFGPAVSGKPENSFQLLNPKREVRLHGNVLSIGR